MRSAIGPQSVGELVVMRKIKDLRQNLTRGLSSMRSWKGLGRSF